MTRGRQLLLAAVVAVAAGGAGYALNAWWRADVHADSAAAIMAVQLPDLEGKSLPIAQWRGRVLVINFWATWCTPCREEIPLFVKLQEKHRAAGLQFIGIAIDQGEKVRAFAQEFGMNYPILLGGMDTVELSRRAGNRLGALPFTIIIDRSGRIAGVELGVVKEAKLESMFKSLL
jgi:thiol-disulfide isomerase/thioredoxin